MLEKAGINPETLNLQNMESQYEKLSSDRKAAHATYQKAERECKDLEKLRDQLLSFMEQEVVPDIDRKKANIHR